jgi:tripartite-type tricarboxylate transporter receptor subunit TctC
VRIIVPFPAGGGTDLFARAIAQKLASALSQQFVTDNRAGAGGMIGSDMVARAAPDGYTLLVTSSSTLSIVPHLTRKPLYDPLKDFSPIALIASAPNVLVVHPSVPAHSVKQLVQLARAQPGLLNVASNGSGTLSHLTAELFKIQTGINLVHIPYKGGPPAVVDLVAGQVSMLFAALPTVLPQVRSGRLRMLGVTGDKRIAAVKEIPTVAESLPGFESVQWWGLLAPAAMASELVEKLNGEVTRAISDPDIRTRFSGEGAEAQGGSAKDFALYMKSDFERWGKVVKEAGIFAE